MKKMKKITALMLSVMTCAASLSAMTSNAALWYIDASNMENFLSDWTAIESKSYVGETLYINNDLNDILLMNNDRADPEIYIDTPGDIDYSEIKKVIQEVDPYSMYYRNYNINGIPTKTVFLTRFYDPESGEGRELTVDDAKKIYEAFKEKGWVDNGWIKDFKFRAAYYTYSEGFLEYGYITAYNIDNKEILEKYINENELNCHLEEGVFCEDSIVKVVPDDEISTIDHLNLYEQIFNDTGVRQRWLINEDTNTLSAGDVDLHNNIVGDANEDGKMDMSDAVLIMQCCSNPDEYRLTAQGRYNADFNNDGITNEDALAIQKILLEIE